jgi:pyruvate/2-oxoglutarate dehydrogenase complex dihydrolipoamide acyltransferase (E2) component
MHVRWQRVQYQLAPFLVVVLCGLVAWRLWHEAPRATVVGQVDSQTAEVHAPVGGRLVAADAQGRGPRVYDNVAKGNVIARVEAEGGKWTDVKAPMNGQIIRIHRETGHAVAAGQSIYTIVADRGTSITTYLRADQRVQPEPGMAVDVRQRADSSRVYHTVVERVGAQYQPIPAAQLRDRKSEEWGLPVVLAMPADADLKPGELVYIGWNAGGSSPAPASPNQSE